MEIEDQKSDVLMRLKRIEGQLRGLQRMVEKGSPCAEIMTQVAAVTAATKRVGMLILQTHLEDCFEKAGESGHPARQKETLRDFQKAISRFIDWA